MEVEQAAALVKVAVFAPVEGVYPRGMPVAERVDWIKRQLAMGRPLYINFGESGDGIKLKVKVVLQSPQYTTRSRM